MVSQIKSVALLSKKHSRKLRYDVSRAHGPRAVAVVAGAGHPLLQRHHVCGEFHYRADARVAASPGCGERIAPPLHGLHQVLIATTCLGPRACSLSCGLYCCIVAVVVAAAATAVVVGTLALAKGAAWAWQKEQSRPGRVATLDHAAHAVVLQQQVPLDLLRCELPADRLLELCHELWAADVRLVSKPVLPRLNAAA